MGLVFPQHSSVVISAQDHVIFASHRASSRAADGPVLICTVGCNVKGAFEAHAN
jgi:hypothetical protein